MLPVIPASPPMEIAIVSDTAAAPTPSIGEATMEPDGTIVLRLRATGPDAVGEALMRYAPADPNYASIRAHLPDLKPGDHAPVPPFN